MKLVADDVQRLVLPSTGYWLTEWAPDELVAALSAFLTPYRDESPCGRVCNVAVSGWLVMRSSSTARAPGAPVPTA